MELTTYVAFFTIAFISALGIFPLLIQMAKKLNYIEQVDERKLHTEKVSSLGGIGIFLACIVSMLFFIEPIKTNLLLGVLMVLPLFIIGLVDDLYKVGVTIRLAVQALLGVLLHEMGFQIIHLENLWWMSMGANVFFIMLMVNAYNFIDGINGLAGGLGLIGSLVFGSLLAKSGSLQLALFCFAYAGSLLCFLCFNFGKKARIFMGDNGSTVLGYLMAFMILALLNAKTGSINYTYYPMIFGVVLIPVCDIFKVALFRLFQGQSPFSADRTHIHHLLTDGALSHPAACAVLFAWTLFVVFIAEYFMLNMMSSPLVMAILVTPYLLAEWVGGEAELQEVAERENG